MRWQGVSVSMINSCYIDGCAFERDDFPEGLYVYQTLMTFGHRALHLGEYLQRLNAASEEVLHREVSLVERDVATLISDFLSKNRYPVAMPASVELRCYLSGEVVLLGGDVSPYPKLGLRLLMPAGVDVSYDVPLSEHHSSVRRAVAEAARTSAESRGAKVAVRFDGEGLARSADDAELFVVKEYTVVMPAAPTSVEGALVCDAIRRAGLQLEVAPLRLEMLDSADEIFYADHRGVTALGSFNGHPLMHILAEKIATYL